MTTVRELIQHLQRYEGDLRVEFETLDGDTAEDFAVEEAFGAVIIKEF